MKKAKQCLTALLPGVLLAITVLSGCGQSQKAVSKNDDHLTVYLWENRLMKNIAPYIHEQFPDQDISFFIHQIVTLFCQCKRVLGCDQISFGREFSWVHNLTTFSFPALLAGIYR